MFFSIALVVDYYQLSNPQTQLHLLDSATTFVIPAAQNTSG
jgi:hypothetical protein